MGCSPWSCQNRTRLSNYTTTTTTTKGKGESQSLEFFGESARHFL